MSRTDSLFTLDYAAHSGCPAVPCSALDLAIRFHETYERLAPQFGYETRLDTRAFDPNSKNGKLMVAVCAEILEQNEPALPTASATPPQP